MPPPAVAAPRKRRPRGGRRARSKVVRKEESPEPVVPMDTDASHTSNVPSAAATELNDTWADQARAPVAAPAALAPSPPPEPAGAIVAAPSSERPAWSKKRTPGKPKAVRVTAGLHAGNSGLCYGGLLRARVVLTDGDLRGVMLGWDELEPQDKL